VAYDRDEIFKAIGKSIARYNELQTMIVDLETINTEHVVVLNESEYTRDMLNNVMRQRQTDEQRLKSSQTDTASTVSRYLREGVAPMLDVVLLGASDPIGKVLDALEDAMYTAAPPDSVECNVIPPPELPSPGSPDLRADIDNAGVGALNPYDFHTQQRHAALEFEFQCYEAATPGAELWRVRNDKESDLGTLTTGVLFELQKYGLKFILNRIIVIEEDNDGAAQLSNWVLNGAVKRTGDQESADSLAKGNSDFYGVYYVKLFDVAGTRTVELYQDNARTILVASGSRVGNGILILVAAGGSGLTGSVVVAYTGDTSTVTIRYPFAFAVGDKYYFRSEVAAPKLFQTFFVEVYDRALPCEPDPNNTVDEDWAKWGLP